MKIVEYEVGYMDKFRPTHTLRRWTATAVVVVHHPELTRTARYHNQSVTAQVQAEVQTVLVTNILCIVVECCSSSYEQNVSARSCIPRSRTARDGRLVNCPMYSGGCSNVQFGKQTSTTSYIFFLAWAIFSDTGMTLFIYFLYDWFYIPPTCANISERSAGSWVWCLGSLLGF